MRQKSELNAEREASSQFRPRTIWLKASAGVRQRRVLRGLVLRVAATCIELASAISAEVGTFGKVLPQQSIRIFIGTTLRRTS
jgi:hypothetical protein